MSSSPPTATAPRRLRIALAHDWLCGVRGGEHVLERIAALILRDHETAGLYVMFDDGRPIGPALDEIAVTRTVSLIGRDPSSIPLRRWLLPLYPLAVRNLSTHLRRDHDRNPIDLVISTSSAAIKGLRPPPGVPHLCYCHSPARYLWSQQRAYRGGLRGVALASFGPPLRAWDRSTARNVTAFIANSHHTAGAIRDHYQRDAVVIHPPVRAMFFQGDAPARNPQAPWLVVSALEPYKRVELAIAAARQKNHPLIVVGNGSLSAELRAANAKASNIRFLGRVPDDELRGLYHQASLLIFPQVEDFGIVPLEAMACGLPVVAFGAGGALETVVDGKTGIFFTEADTAALLSAIESCPRGGEPCRRQAARFGEPGFDAAMTNAIHAAVARTT